jgi:hypothetical protein
VRDNVPGIRDEERELILVPFHTTKPGPISRTIAIALPREARSPFAGPLRDQFCSTPLGADRRQRPPTASG